MQSRYWIQGRFVQCHVEKDGGCKGTGGKTKSASDNSIHGQNRYCDMIDRNDTLDTIYNSASCAFCCSISVAMEIQLRTSRYLLGTSLLQEREVERDCLQSASSSSSSSSSSSPSSTAASSTHGPAACVDFLFIFPFAGCDRCACFLFVPGS